VVSHQHWVEGQFVVVIQHVLQHVSYVRSDVCSFPQTVPALCKAESLVVKARKYHMLRRFHARKRFPLPAVTETSHTGAGREKTPHGWPSQGAARRRNGFKRQRAARRKAGVRTLGARDNASENERGRTGVGCAA